ncbi:Mitochondrial glutamate carrier [Operophtera brumata]|uniref:Mitochondrial glutamate carrier n=1 Tax=Operophtera brumata TaxID=104452 RepID=A0A0L7KTR3_OPEBR|nr:Mitochondrial glutamate carrier [Operophtera brumata]
MLLSLWTAKRRDKDIDICKSEPDRCAMAATMVETPPPQLITTIEWSMMDKRKFFPLYTLSSFTGVFYISTYEGVRHELGKHDVSPKVKSFVGGGCASIVGQTIIVPFDVLSQHLMVLGLVRSRAGGSRNPKINPLGLDLDKNTSKANLAREVAVRVYRLHGLRGYYRGYCASLAAYVPNSALWWALYTTYQGECRLHGLRGYYRGYCASLAAYVPNSALWWALYTTYQGECRLRGYYRGYCASLAAYVPNSALWWALYTTYQDELFRVAPSWVSHLLIQCVAGTLGGFTTTVLTNPLDIVRARLQVEGVGTMKQVFKQLWAEEGLLGLYAKGLSARLVQSACFSFSIILGYESIKRVAVSDQYRATVRW